MVKKREFSPEFKLERVRLIKERGVSVAQAARDLGVHANVLRRWVRGLGQQFDRGANGAALPEQAEIVRLKKEVAKLKLERDILKKAAAYFAQESL